MELAEEVIDKNRCDIYLLGNKADLYKNIEVPENEAQNFSKKNKLEFRLISAKDNVFQIDEYIKKYIENTFDKIEIGNYITLNFREEERLKAGEFIKSICGRSYVYKVSYPDRLKKCLFLWYFPEVQCVEKETKNYEMKTTLI